MLGFHIFGSRRVRRAKGTLGRWIEHLGDLLLLREIRNSPESSRESRIISRYTLGPA